MTKTQKVIFFGTPDFAVPALKSLIDNNYDVVAVFTGQGPISVLARENKIKIFQPASLKRDEQVFEEFKSLKPDICIIAAYGKILPPRYLEIPKFGFLNIHPSILPKYRGPSPIQTAIINGDPALQRTDASGKTNRSLNDGAGAETGVTIMLMDDKIDHGPILAQKPYYLPPTIYYSQAEKELAKLGAKLLIETLPKYISGEIEPKEQDHNQATFTKMFSRDDGHINWSEGSAKIYNQIRALNPEPGTWTTWKGKVINISTVTPFNGVSPQGVGLELKTPGTVVKIDSDIAIGTGTGYLILKSVQLEGRKVMDAKSFLNGHPDFLNSKLE